MDNSFQVSMFSIFTGTQSALHILLSDTDCLKVKENMYGPFKQSLYPLSSILAWRIPGTGEPGGLVSMGSHGVGHD